MTKKEKPKSEPKKEPRRWQWPKDWGITAEQRRKILATLDNDPEEEP